MCGIITVFAKKGNLDIAQCDRALNRLKLRGPDFSFREIYYNNRLYFGQTVLSITGYPYDTKSTYHKSKTGRYDIVLNGEIYNFKKLYETYLEKQKYFCHSNTDTETLLNLHEVISAEEVFDNLRGMFAYIIYDNKENRLIIGRDIIGEKILYKYEDETILILSSEIGPIMELIFSLELNIDVLREYFFTRHLLTPMDTVFHGITLIQPGNLLEYDLTQQSFSTLKIIRLADLIDPVAIEKNRTRSIDDLLEELESVFRSNARILAPEQVDYTCVMSGGVDSSLSSYYMNIVKKPSNLLALEFLDKDKISENLVPFSNHFGRPISKIRVDAELFLKSFDESYSAVCTPFPTHSFISQAIVSKNVRKEGSKVWVGGHGGDELFGGYNFYKSLNGNNSFPLTNPSIYSGLFPLGLVFEGWNDEILKDRIKSRWKEYSYYFEFEDKLQERMIQTVLYSDIVIQLESVGIREADTMSMLHSVEPRCFYLTWDVLKFALNLPARFKLDLSSSDPKMITRPLMKKLFISKFGQELLYPKQGFSGFPNEAGRKLVRGEYTLTEQVLGLIHVPDETGLKQQAIEWKMINMELFLRHCQKKGYI